MKNIILIASILILFSMCSEEETPKPVNNFANTVWEASDEVTSFSYRIGKIKTISFYSDYTCKVNSFWYVDYNDQYGTYNVNGKNITWTIDNVSTTGCRNGNKITTSSISTTGGNVVYKSK